MKLKTITKVIVIISMTLFWYSQYVYVPYQSPYIVTLGGTAFIVGVVSGAYGLTQTILRIPIGLLANKENKHKKLILIGLLFASAASVIRIVFVRPEYFIIANLLSGVASAMWISYTVFFASLFKNDEAKKSMGISMAASNVGILAGFISGSIINEQLGIKYIFMAAVIAGVVGFICSIFIKEESFVPSAGKTNISSEKLLNKPFIILCILGFITQAVVMSTAMSFTTVYAKNIAQSDLEIGISMIVLIAASLLASIYISYTKRDRNRVFIIIFFLCEMIYCILIPLCNKMWELNILQGIAGIANGGLMSLLMALVINKTPKNKSSVAMGTYQAIYGIGMTIIPVIVGSLIDKHGFLPGYWFLAVLTVAGVLLAYRTKALD